ncbi:MAG: hypothetical protein ACRERE_24230 [Candidatus Entotheonellia bacterium]
MALLVPIHRTFADPILGRNGSERLSRYEPIVNGDPGWMGANGAKTRHERLSVQMALKCTKTFKKNVEIEKST